MTKALKIDYGENINSISWVVVNSLGKLKFSRNSYYYLVIIPILVKALDKINSPFFIKIAESNIPINLELPFSWYLFYFGALMIAIASILYQIFCPELIKSYRNYGEFLEAGESDDYLEKVSRKYKLSIFFLPLAGEPYLEEKTIEKEKIEPKSRRYEPTYREYEKVVGYKQNIKYQEDRKNAFNKLYNEVKFSNKKVRNISFGLYIVGFAAFTWVIIQNIYFVVIHLI